MEKDLDDWLSEGLEESVKKAQQQAPPRTLFPTVPSGTGVPKAPPPAPEKPKSLQTIGIGRGGVVRNSTTVVRTQLNNPVANPKANSRNSSIIDRAELTPEFGVPTIMREMDANLEANAKEKLEDALVPAPAGAPAPLPTAPAQMPQDGPPGPRMITLRSTLAELIETARDEGGSLVIGTRQFSLNLEIKIPF